MRKRLTTELFIQRSKVIHGEDCSYNKSIYELNNKKLIITCERDKTHGDFLMTPHTHMSGGCGCPKCFGKIKSNTTEFIKNL